MIEGVNKILPLFLSKMNDFGDIEDALFELDYSSYEDLDELCHLFGDKCDIQDNSLHATTSDIFEGCFYTDPERKTHVDNYTLSMLLQDGNNKPVINFLIILTTFSNCRYSVRFHSSVQYTLEKVLYCIHRTLTKRHIELGDVPEDCLLLGAEFVFKPQKTFMNLIFNE